MANVRQKKGERRYTLVSQFQSAICCWSLNIRQLKTRFYYTAYTYLEVQIYLILGMLMKHATCPDERTRTKNIVFENMKTWKMKWSSIVLILDLPCQTVSATVKLANEFLLKEA
jgi:hypothetical protein